MITRSPSLTDQVKAHVRERIEAGGFEDGRIPPEVELAEELGVSRTTVRDALSRLENEGAIYRKQGAGTFVNEQGLQIRSRLEEIWSYTKVLEDHGYTPSVKIVSEKTGSPDEATSEALGLEDGEEVLTITKLFLEDDEPVILTTNHIPVRILADGDYAEDESLPLYEFIEDHSEQALSYYLSEIIPVCLEGEIAEQLGVAEGTVALSFHEVGYDQANEPIVRATSFFRDDLLRFRLIRRRTRT